MDINVKNKKRAIRRRCGASSELKKLICMKAQKG
jgi:hypothetical protein